MDLQNTLTARTDGEGCVDRAQVLRYGAYRGEKSI
jgi:hypothetical protein